MNWTVRQRITAGFALILALLVIVVSVGWWALGNTAEDYEQALQVRRSSLVPALRSESELRSANIEALRFLLEGDELYARRRDSTIVLTRALMTQARDSATDPETRRRWEEALVLLADWDRVSLRTLALRRANNLPEALRVRRDSQTPIRAQLDDRVRQVIITKQQESDDVAEAAGGTASSARTALVGGGLLALIAGVLSAFFLIRALNRRLEETTGVLASSAAEILAAATEQAAGANESMAAVSETVATADEVAQTAAQASERARAVADSAARAAEISQAGRAAVADSAAAMRGVREQVEGIAESIVSLADQAQAIGEIITAVSEIAEQTNLLALNARVESARAGEHGRGFAVVADEIKELAGQAKRSTVQVRTILGDIQRATSAAVMATERGTKQAAGATDQVNRAGETIEALAAAAADAAQTAAQIVASAGQQAIGMEQIRQAIGNIHDATQQNLASTRQAESAARQLDQLGARLVALVGGVAKEEREEALARTGGPGGGGGRGAGRAAAAAG